MDFIKAKAFLEDSTDSAAGNILKDNLPDADNTFIKSMLENCIKWPGQPLMRHNDAAHALHQMHILLDFGFSKEDSFMHNIASKILENQSSEGAFQVNMQISEHYGGSGQPELNWSLCDFPLLLEFLITLGYRHDDRVQKGISFLLMLCDDNGWRCKTSIKGFRGPGRKIDYCPAATLFSLRAFSHMLEYHNHPTVISGIDALYNHWELRKEKKFYLFGMGTDFRKLKYPTAWFDIVHVCKTLSHFEYARSNPIFGEWLSAISAKQQPDGGFIPESIYMAYKNHDFGQKKVSSPTLTYIIYSFMKNCL